jgi:hypothetical protein
LSGSYRDNFHTADTIARKAKNFLYQQSEDIYSIYQISYLFGSMISAVDPERVHEIWMVYFPIEALGAEKKKQSQLPRLMNIYEPHEKPHLPMSGILSQKIAWLSGEVTYQEVQCQRLAWFMEWRSKEAEELYKTKAQWDWEGEGKHRKPKLLLNTFIDDLKRLGMIGYEAWHAQFVEVQAPLGI